MAHITKFKISNFRGIESATISLAERIHTPIVTLIGLNESGKTTILEALSHFSTGDPIVSKIFEEKSEQGEALTLVPISKKANFTGAVAITATVTLQDADIRHFQSIASDEFDVQLDDAPLREPFEVKKVYTFKDGNFTSSEARNIWTISIKTKTPKAKKFTNEVRKRDETSLNSRIWQELLKRLPSISYFPTFLVSLPARIYLCPHEGELDTNRYYRSVLQDVLDSLGEGLTLDTHVAQRIRDFKANEKSPNWFSIFWGTPAKGQVSSVIQKLSNAMGREIIGSWSKIFHKSTSAKSVNLEWNIDTEKGDLPYISILISDGESEYALHERSLGFRWFFSFLLFTRFKQAKGRETLFLFDEPAANLHARAQGELLQSFERIQEEGHKIIYSTHSHHMINPAWLSGAYIIENKAIDYDKDLAIDALTPGKTNITATSYRTFVSQSPDRVSYYQPVMEKLDYINPSVIPTKPMVITEGISDYHALSTTFREQSANLSFELLPGLGAEASGPLISFLIAMGRPFVILLDDDKAGRKAADAYRNKWILSDEVATLADIDPDYKGKKLETLISGDTHKVICLHLGKKGELASKREIGAYFAEMAYSGQSRKLSSDTKRSFEAILAWLDRRFR